MRTLLLTFICCSFVGAPALRSQIIGSALTAAGAAILAKDKDIGTQAGVVGAAALVGGWAGRKLEEKQAQRDFRNYQLGRWQEAWLRNNTDWYTSTMNRHSGLPPAFDGYWAMYSGLPEQERAFVQQRLKMPMQSVPTTREEYLAYLSLLATSPGATNNPDSGVVLVPSTTATMPQRTVRGVEYRARVREFPTLP